ncbi:hypothetical protein I317_07203 [Kwoniella heveanensis CBS 569]|nr:hypothetical protein I317_07203 [Kwoniella heveanensis CBS 569]
MSSSASHTDYSVSVFDADGNEHVSQAFNPAAQSSFWSTNRSYGYCSSRAVDASTTTGADAATTKSTVGPAASSATAGTASTAASGNNPQA